MYRLKAANGAAYGGGGKKAEGSTESGGGIGENIAKNISREDDIKLTLMTICMAVIDIHVIEFYVATRFRECFDCITKVESVEDIGFVDAGYLIGVCAQSKATALREFRLRSSHGVPGSFFAPSPSSPTSSPK